MDTPLVIPVFIPHSGCPHQCAFCNQSIITNQKNLLPQPGEIDEIISRYLGYKAHRTRVELAFFGGNFLGLSNHEILRLLEKIAPYRENGTIHSIRFSTRPDTITKEKLDLIAPHGVSLVELGVQSMTDSVLKLANRGHTSFDTRRAIALLKERQIQVGVQVMTGLPGDTKTQLLDGTKQLAALGPNVARIYPLMVLSGSLLAQWYGEGHYTPLSLDTSVDLVKEMYKIFEKADVAVIRMGLQASEMMEDQSQVLAGPWHPAFGHLVFSAIAYERVVEKIEAFRARALASQIQANQTQANQTQVNWTNKILLGVNPRFESRLRGDKNGNLKKLKQLYPDISFSIKTNESLLEGEVDISPAGNQTDPLYDILGG